MLSRRFLLLLLLFVSLDFAVPYEPAARGGFELEDEEDAVHLAGRRAQRPESATAVPSSPRHERARLANRARLAQRTARPAAARAEALRPPRAALLSTAPASPTEDH